MADISTATTRMWPYGGSGHQYGSFDGKQTQEAPAAPRPRLVWDPRRRVRVAVQVGLDIEE